MNITAPKIRKARYIRGRTLVFRNAVVNDAEFILSLRTDPDKAKYLSQTRNNLEQQRNWLENYSINEGQAYFIIENDGEAIGTVRLYDAKGKSFCWGSWIIKNGSPSHAAIESALMVYAFSTDSLEFTASHFDVRKDNEHVVRFHERFGAKRTGETREDYLFSISIFQIKDALRKYSRFLINPLEVEFFQDI
ncbi:hypothetical protein CHL79_12085 [Delftia acidovorans]|uniref:GNAT family N-acetyltransferase n=1 Tax=Delftia acidovorans TaxID=80866 RepID=UPI000BC2E8CF|nr:GNAT family N-acetyltransferase [Delftia acidovorans]ATH13101.1 hypothetical protein CHL79_12085 [Delftia acidovorans]